MTLANGGVPAARRGPGSVVHPGGPGPAFLAELSVEDLRRLRLIVKKQFMRSFPKDKFTDAEADRIIESYGPATQEALIRRAVAQKLHL